MHVQGLFYITSIEAHIVAFEVALGSLHEAGSCNKQIAHSAVCHCTHVDGAPLQGSALTDGGHAGTSIVVVSGYR